MKVQVQSNGDVSVMLSERNLETLVRLWAAATKGEAVPVLHRRQAQDAPGEDGRLLSVGVEPDEIHYQDRSLGPGIGPDDI